MDIRDKVLINPQAQKILKQILKENPELKAMLDDSENQKHFKTQLEKWAKSKLSDQKLSKYVSVNNSFNRQEFENLEWTDYAAIRLLDYINNDDLQLEDLNLEGRIVKSDPIKYFYLAYKNGKGGAETAFFIDFLYLFRQLQDKYKPAAMTKKKLKKWMKKYPAGYESDIASIQQENKDRIIRVLIEKIDNGEIRNQLFTFKPDDTYSDKLEKMNEWWKDYRFHLAFAVRSPDLLNELLDHSLSPGIMKKLYKAEKKGMTFFVNPYYLSLVMVKGNAYPIGIDQTIRDYMIYSDQLIEEFGNIVAWEKEDQVEPGKPNAAGWILPTNESMHRRYPNVAILIPDTMARACAGLCSTCQRMYDFQRGHLNFDYNSKKPEKSWPEKLQNLMDYFKNDAQLRDILITGGDALMSSNQSLKQILEAVYKMAKEKKEKNKKREQGAKYAEMVRVRLGTRLPVYLPQRIDDGMLEILKDFKKKAKKIGIKQFVIQTHIESPLEITNNTREAINKFLQAGWIVTNQLVFTTSASKRGHTAKLRKVLNDIGVLTYYTFSCKGYMENYHHFATNARAVQEQLEEKCYGQIPEELENEINNFLEDVPHMKQQLDNLRAKASVDFLSTDRNMLNLPAVGKSLTFRTIGITRDGRRILEFDHDPNRAHSPIIKKMGKVKIIESKSVYDYLQQLEKMGEDIEDYQGIYGYSIGATEKRLPIYQYPEYDFQTTQKITNLKV